MACSRPREVHRAFYFWKQKYTLSPAEKSALAALQVSRLYVKCFDVA